MVTTAWIPTFSHCSLKHGMIALRLICMRQREVTHCCVETHRLKNGGSR